MGKIVGGAPKSAATANMVAEASPVKLLANSMGVEGSMAEQLAAKKNARTRGGSRALLSDARINAQEGLSATSTLG
jgi:hypothetical protein